VTAIGAGPDIPDPDVTGTPYSPPRPVRTPAVGMRVVGGAGRRIGAVVLGTCPRGPRWLIEWDDGSRDRMGAGGRTCGRGTVLEVVDGNP